VSLMLFLLIWSPASFLLYLSGFFGGNWLPSDRGACTIASTLFPTPCSPTLSCSYLVTMQDCMTHSPMVTHPDSKVNIFTQKKKKKKHEGLSSSLHMSAKSSADVARHCSADPTARQIGPFVQGPSHGLCQSDARRAGQDVDVHRAARKR
jgi:hypothetical protein